MARLARCKKKALGQTMSNFQLTVQWSKHVQLPIHCPMVKQCPTSKSTDQWSNPEQLVAVQWECFNHNVKRFRATYI